MLWCWSSPRTAVCAGAFLLQAEGTADVKTLSMMRSRNFAKDYGMLIEDGPLAGITARCGAGAGREQHRAARTTGR